MNAEQRQTTADSWTKPASLSHWPACSHLNVYNHYSLELIEYKCFYLTIFAARYECKSCGDERIHLTQLHVDLHVEAATIHDTGTLHGTLSNV